MTVSLEAFGSVSLRHRMLIWWDRFKQLQSILPSPSGDQTRHEFPKWCGPSDCIAVSTVQSIDRSFCNVKSFEAFLSSKKQK